MVFPFAVSTRIPSELNATNLGVSIGTMKARISLPDATSQRRASSASDPVSTRAPSGLKATDTTPPPCPLNAHFLPGRSIPQAGCGVRCSGEYACGIGTEGNGFNPACMPGEHTQLLSRLHIPQPGGVVA